MRVETFTDDNSDKWVSLCQSIPEGLFRHIDRFNDT
jgi:hypothetical protein